LEAGYTLEQIVQASMAAEEIKQSRAESLRSAGWSNPMELLNGAAETTGAALKAVDVLGIGSAAGAVVGAGAAMGKAAGKSTISVVNGSGKLLVNGVTTSTKAMADGVTTVGNGMIDATKTVGNGVTNVVRTSATLLTTSVTSTGKAVVAGARKLSPKRTPEAIMT
jgi:hypothetical protein